MTVSRLNSLKNQEQLEVSLGRFLQPPPRRPTLNARTRFTPLLYHTLETLVAIYQNRLSKLRAKHRVASSHSVASLLIPLRLQLQLQLQVKALRRDPVCIQPPSSDFPRFIGLQDSPLIPNDPRNTRG